MKRKYFISSCNNVIISHRMWKTTYIYFSTLEMKRQVWTITAIKVHLNIKVHLKLRKCYLSRFGIHIYLYIFAGRHERDTVLGKKSLFANENTLSLFLLKYEPSVIGSISSALQYLFFDYYFWTWKEIS